MLIQAVFFFIFGSMSHTSKTKKDSLLKKLSIKILRIKHKILKHNFDIQLSLFKNKKKLQKTKIKRNRSQSAKFFAEFKPTEVAFADPIKLDPGDVTAPKGIHWVL